MHTFLFYEFEVYNIINNRDILLKKRYSTLYHGIMLIYPGIPAWRYYGKVYLARSALKSPGLLMTSCRRESRTRSHSRHTNPSSSSTAELSPSSPALASGLCLRLRSPFSATASSLQSCCFCWFCWALILRTIESLSMFTAAAPASWYQSKRKR